MKALVISFNWGYDKLMCSKKLLNDRPKCRASLLNAGTTQKAKTISKVSGSLKYMKSITIVKFLAWFLNSGHLETTKSNFMKFCHSRPEQAKNFTMVIDFIYFRLPETLDIVLAF